MALIECLELTKRFGDITAVEGLSLAVEAGEVLGLLGPNGAGKTTTIRMLSGIIAPTSGYAVIDGLRVDQQVERVHEMMGVLADRPGFYERLSARRNLEFFAGFYGNINVIQQVEKYLRVVGLWERREGRVGTFSKGMKQRLALARALVPEPRILFLDEPTAGLDPEAARELRELITSLSREGRTVIVSTHNLAEAESLCHRIAVIRTRLLALDTAERLRQRFFRREVEIELEVASDQFLRAVKSLTFVQSVRVEGPKMIVELVEPDKHRPELVSAIVAAGGRILAVNERHHHLEEVYLKLIREETSP